MDLALLKDISIIVAGVIAFLTLWHGLIQYARQGHATRASQFVQMRRRFLEDATFKEILNRIAENDPSVAEMPIQDRRNLVGFLEEVALLVNSNLIKPDVAHYMFGYYVLLIDENEHFWTGLQKDSEYWTVFRSLASKMRQPRTQNSEISV